MTNFYADGFQLSVGLVDAKIDFLSVDPVRNENGEVIKEVQNPQYRIAMSLPLAKTLVAVLGSMLEDHEKNIAPIADLSSLMEKINPNGK